MPFLGTVPTMTPPYEVITELRFGKQPSQQQLSIKPQAHLHWRRPHIILHYLLTQKHCSLSSEQHSLTGDDQRHIWKCKHALPLLCQHSLAGCVSQKILTEHIVVSLFPLCFSMLNSQRHNKINQFTLPIKASWPSNNNPILLKET